MYTAFRDHNGKVQCIQKGNMSIPLSPDNIDYKEFLVWQSQQETPLDLSDGPTAEEQRIAGLTLDAYKLERAAAISEEVRTLIYSRYEPHRQMSLTNMKMGATPNKLAYIEQLWNWIGQCLVYYYGKEDAISAATTKEEVAAIVTSQGDFDALIALDPEVTIRQAMSILD